MAKSRATSANKSKRNRVTGEGSGAEKVSALPLPPEQRIQLPDALRWKAKAFQADAEKAQANVKAAHAELLLRQAELQRAQQALQDVVREATEELRDMVPPGYSLAELNPTDGLALCRLAPKEE